MNDTDFSPKGMSVLSLGTQPEDTHDMLDSQESLLGLGTSASVPNPRHLSPKYLAFSGMSVLTCVASPGYRSPDVGFQGITGYLGYVGSPPRHLCTLSLHS